MTGLGVLSPYGSGQGAFWKGLTSAKPAYRRVRGFDTTDYRTHIGGEVKGFSPPSAVGYAGECVRQALKDAGLTPGSVDLARCGVILGTTSGDFSSMEPELDRHFAGQAWPATEAAVRPFSPGAIPAFVARALGFRGPALMLTPACSAGNAALVCAFNKIVEGQADIIAAGGVEVFARITFAGFNRLLAVAPKACAPFSAGRRGLIPSEGGAVLLLEERARAQARGARIYGELLGFGVSSDASHLTMPAVEGIARAIADCLQDAGLAAAEVDYISAHGTGTPANDKVETAAIRQVLGARAPEVPVSSIKSMLGHAMGAASAFEAAACCLALRTGVLPPTANFTGGDPDCGLDYVPNKARLTRPRTVLSNSFAFGGSNFVIALAGARPGGRPAACAPPRLAVTGLGAVEENDPLALAEALLPDKDLRYLDRPIAFALCGVSRALQDAGLGAGPLPEQSGIILDTWGELDSQMRFYRDLTQGGPSAVEPRLFPNALSSAAASRAAILFGLKFINQSLAGSFPAGESALAAGCDLLRRKGKGLLLVGGIREGASVMVLETLEAARARGARIYAEVIGYRESFEPEAAEEPSLGCFSLAKALRKPPKAGIAWLFKGRGAWGGRIEFELAEVKAP